MTRSSHTLALAALMSISLATPLLARGPSKKATSKEGANETIEAIVHEPTKIPEEKEPDGKPTTPVNTITVFGSSVMIVDDCQADEVRITTDGVLNTWISSDLVEINVALIGDANYFKYQAGTNTERMIHERHISILGGDKFDTIDINLNGNESGQGTMSVGAPIRFDIDTGFGQDTVSILVADVEVDGAFRVNADLGGNNDTLTCNKFANLYGEFSLTVAGGANEDIDHIALFFNSHIRPSGNLDVFCHGGHDFDWIQCEYEGVVEGMAHFYLYGNDFFDIDVLPIDLGNPFEEEKEHLIASSATEFDTITLDVRPLAGSVGSIFATVEDGLGDDNLVLQVTNEDGATPLVVANLNGGYGSDHWYATGYDDFPGEYVEVENVEVFEPSFRLD